MAAEGDEHKQAKRHKENGDGVLGAVVSFCRYRRLSQVSVVVGIVIMQQKHVRREETRWEPNEADAPVGIPKTQATLSEVAPCCCLWSSS